jgi:pyruvate dehydrogenase E2 component (dihydrolipoamide acetyltransferase)
LGGIYKDESESTASLIDVDSPHVTAVDPDFLSQEVKTTTQAERLEREAAEEEEKKKRAEEESNKKPKARKAKSSGLSDNSNNPVYIGNALLYTVIGAGLGFGAYRKHAQGKLSWETIGLWSGAVGAVGVVDYFVSK